MEAAADARRQKNLDLDLIVLQENSVLTKTAGAIKWMSSRAMDVSCRMTHCEGLRWEIDFQNSIDSR